MQRRLRTWVVGTAALALILSIVFLYDGPAKGRSSNPESPGLLSAMGSKTDSREPVRTVGTPAASQPAGVAASPFEAPRAQRGSWLVRFVDSESREPITKVRVEILESPLARTTQGVFVPGESNEEGTITIPAHGYYRAQKESYAPKFLDLSSPEAAQITEIPLVRGAVVTGTVKDFQGIPVVGVWLSIRTSDVYCVLEKPNDALPPEEAGILDVAESGGAAFARTDGSGSFTFPMVKCGKAQVLLLTSTYVLADNRSAILKLEPGTNVKDFLVSPVYFAASVIRNGQLPPNWTLVLAQDAMQSLHASWLSDPSFVIDQGAMRAAIETKVRSLVEVGRDDTVSIHLMRTKEGEIGRAPAKEVTCILITPYGRRDTRGERYQVAVQWWNRLDVLERDSIRVIETSTPAAPTASSTTKVTLRFLMADGSRAMHRPPVMLLRSLPDSIRRNSLPEDDKAGSEIELSLAPGKYELEPDEHGTWRIAHSFDRKSIHVVADEPQDVTVRLNIPVAVMRPRIVDRLGRPASHCMVAGGPIGFNRIGSGHEGWLVRDDDRQFRLLVHAVGQDAKPKEIVSYPVLPLGKITDVTFTVPYP